MSHKWNERVPGSPEFHADYAEPQLRDLLPRKGDDVRETIRDLQSIAILASVASESRHDISACGAPWLTRSQLGTIAAQNACFGPVRDDDKSEHYGRRIPRLDNRTRISLLFSNITSGLDELLHGMNNVRRWGVLPFPKPTLYQIRGFDPASREFL